MKRLIVLLYFFLATAALRAQSYTTRAVNLDNSLLWKITGNGLLSPSYLFASYSYIGKSFVDSLPVIKKVFNKCRIYVGETIIDTDANASSKYMDEWVLESGSLTTIYTLAQFSRIDSVLNKYAHVIFGDLRPDILKELKPAVVEALLYVAMLQHDVSKNNPSLPGYFQNEAIKNNDTIMGFETAKYQLDLALLAPIEVQKRHLLFMIDNIDLAAKNMTTIYQLYRQQNLSAIEKVALTDREFNPEERDKMIKDRNNVWTERLPEIMKRGPAFIAVGVEHVIWDCGLINQLRLKGYSVTPVTN